MRLLQEEILGGYYMLGLLIATFFILGFITYVLFKILKNIGKIKELKLREDEVSISRLKESTTNNIALLPLLIIMIFFLWRIIQVIINVHYE